MQKQLPAVLIPLFLLCCSALSAQKWDTLTPVPERLTFAVASVVNGKIHLIGGGGTGGASNAHYEYDPATNKWTARAPLPYLAQQPAGAAVNGKIHHFGGGYPNSGSPLKVHYIYDPASNSWSPGADLTSPRAIHYGVGLNGQLYTLAGQGMAKLCEVYDTLTNSWVRKNDLPDNNFWYGAHMAANGKMYRFGGGGYTAPVKSAHEYDPALDKWTSIPNLPNAVHAISGAAIGGKIYLVGGYFNFIESDEVLVYDIDAQTYTYTTPLPRGRDYHNVVAIDSCLYVIGGNNAIDPDVSFQLLRFCPAVATAVSEAGQSVFNISSSYNSGKLGIRVTETLGAATLPIRLINMEGQAIYTGLLTTDASGYGEVFTGVLHPAIYFIQLETKKGTLCDKIFVHP